MVTQEQIARKLGVSRQLVTFALAGYPQVSAESRKRILAAARKMGYRPNPHARALKQERTGIIALWLPDAISSYYTYVAREVNRLVKAAHLELIVSEVREADGEQILSHVPVDGIFAVDAVTQATAHMRSASRGIPLISIGAECCEKTDFVEVDLRTGSEALVKHLIQSGYRRILHATFMSETHPFPYRRAAYARTMRAAGLKPEYMIYPLSESQREIVREQIKEYIELNGKPEAIFCHSDDAAMGIYRGLCDLGLKVPRDVALAGCDGIQDTEYLETPLTTLVQPVASLCATAWSFLENRWENPKIKKQTAHLTAELQVRPSTLRTR